MMEVFKKSAPDSTPPTSRAARIIVESRGYAREVEANEAAKTLIVATPARQPRRSGRFAFATGCALR